jgi:N-acetylglucosamine-6-phosphate deacetylase
VPRFIDLPVHGGLGGDSMSGEAALRKTLADYGSYGTVAMTPTTVTAPIKEIEAALADITATQAKPRPGEAAVLAVHLEGSSRAFSLSGRDSAARGQAWCRRPSALLFLLHNMIC